MTYEEFLREKVNFDRTFGFDLEPSTVNPILKPHQRDIVVWAEDPVDYIKNTLSPTKVSKVIIDKDIKKARVLVPEDQLSIAIGKNGQNVRLASKLTGYELDVEANQPAAAKEAPKEEAKEKPAAKPAPQKIKKKSELESSLLEAIEEHGEEAKAEEK